MNGKPRPACGQCHSTMVYCDTEPQTGVKIIRCMKCGNQHPGNGPKFYMTGQEDDMPLKEAICDNCRQPGKIVSGGKCWPCYSAVRGLKPGTEEYKEALLNIKEKRQSKARTPQPEPGPENSESIVDQSHKATKKKASKPITERIAEVKAKHPSVKKMRKIQIFIREKDFPILDSLAAAAEKNRRTISQEAMIIIETGLLQQSLTSVKIHFNEG